MKKLFVDTNIVIDLLAKREPFYTEAAQLFSMADNKHIELSISALTIANTSYVLVKQMEAKKAKAILRKLSLLLKVLPLNDKILNLSLNDEKFTDFEDAIQNFTALENRQNIIITRNLCDYKQASLPIMTAQQSINSENKRIK